jgi:hypothetical protein
MPPQNQPHPVTEQFVYADPGADGLLYVNNKKRKW